MSRLSEEVKLPLLCYCGSSAGLPQFLFDSYGLRVRVVCAFCGCGAEGPTVMVDLWPAIKEAAARYSAMHFEDKFRREAKTGGGSR